MEAVSPRVTKLENSIFCISPNLSQLFSLVSGQRRMRWVGNKGFLLASLEPQGAQSLNDDSGDHKKGVPSSFYHKANWYPRA